MKPQTAVRTLKKSDKVLAKIIGRVGPCRLFDDNGKESYFEALAGSIIYQQLSGKIAAVILERFKKLFPRKKFPAPENVARTPVSRLKRAGLSAQKAAYLKDLAKKTISGELNFQSLDKMSDEEIVENLTRVKGIGPWTAQMFLMFRLKRPDVLPSGDYGFKSALQKAYKLKTFPTPEIAGKMGEKWKPYRSIAVWYLWQFLDLPAKNK